MRRIGILLLGLIFIGTACFGCGIAKNPPRDPEPETVTGGDSNIKGGLMEFQSIRISETGMMAYSTVYYAEKTDTGVHLEYYMGRYYWDGNDQKEDKQMIHQVDGDETLYQKVARLAAKYDLISWDGFSGSDPNVLDGYSFSFDATLADGKTISASGSNKYPDGYRGFTTEMDELLSKTEITEREFDGGDYTILLPESWAGNVTARYREGYISFEVQTEVQNRTIFILYNEPYEYGDGKDGYQTIKQYKKNGADWYIVMHRFYEADSAYNEMNDAQKAICDALDEDMKKIADSLELK